MMRAALFLVLTMVGGWASAQSPATDIFLMPGSDLVRPGNLPRVNLNIGIGHCVGSNEFTTAYTYENAGNHGFWHSNQGAHTESIGIMRSINFNKTWALYGWQQIGLTSITGSSAGVQNRLYLGASLGGIYHITDRHGIWFQESYNKVETVPWYTSTNIGYVFSF
jgi:hypothetical protein